MPVTLPSRREWLIVLALITTITLAFYSIVQPGNTLGIDEWMHVHRVTHGTPEMSSRPLALVVMWLLFPLINLNVMGWHIVSLVMWVITAFLVYLTVRLIDPERPLFALMCGILYIVYFQDDFWLPLFFLQTVDALTSALFTAAALCAHFATMRLSDSPPRVRLPLLIASGVLAFLSPMVREASVVILITLPILIFVLQRQYDRRHGLGVAVIVGATFAAALRYVLPLIGIGETYGAGIFTDLDPARMGGSILVQYRFFLDPLIQRASVRPVIMLVGVLGLVISGGLVLLMRLVPQRIDADLRRDALWVAGSAIAIFLGFAAYLPTIYADSVWRTHMLSRPAEASLIASTIWLISDLIPPIMARRVVRVLGVLYVTAAGTAMLWQQQTALTQLGGTWGTMTTFMESLAAQVPDVNEPTLIVFMELPPPHEAPFTSGFGFQYAMRYFYSERATGLIPSDHISGTVEVSDDGFLMTESWVEGSHLYGWDEVIFITREEDGTVVILGTLPDAYHTPARQSQYDPHARIADGEIAPRLRETFGVGE